MRLRLIANDSFRIMCLFQITTKLVLKYLILGSKYVPVEFKRRFLRKIFINLDLVVFERKRSLYMQSIENRQRNHYNVKNKPNVTK